jgi:N-glycosylase/DNA lyase
MARGMSDDRLANYFRQDDDLEAIYRELGWDENLSSFFRSYRGLRLIRQDPWECMASYVLATNANIPRIQGMIERVCRAFGTGWTASTRSPRPAAAGPLRARRRLRSGVQERTLHRAGRMAYREEIDFQGLMSMGYDDCVRELVKLPGIGPKVADCVSVFSLEHLEAFPVDVRIRKAMAELYGIEGSYRTVNRLSRERFGPWAGYAQEYIYYAYGR